MKRISSPRTVVMTAQQAELHGWKTDWGTIEFLATIYNAGRVDGIRAERARRQRKDTPNED